MHSTEVGTSVRQEYELFLKKREEVSLAPSGACGGRMTLPPAAPCARASVCVGEAWACAGSLEVWEVLWLLVLLIGPICLSIALPCLADEGGRPPLCAPCGLPSLCLASGVLGTLTTLVLTIVPFTLLLLLTPSPCDTALGGCGSISCVCGSYYFEG